MYFDFDERIGDDVKMMNVEYENVLDDHPGKLHFVFVNTWDELLPAHWHEHLEIIYVTGGGITASINDMSYELKEGDIFLIHVLNETLAYKVDQIKVVEPSETDDLKIVPGYDYATLVTCTPYGINSHRLLVRGIRTEYTQDVSDEAAGQAEEGPDGGGWKAMYEKAIIEGILFAVILVVLINVIVRKFGKKNKSEVAIYDEKEKKEKKPCKKAGKRRRRKSKR